MQCAGALVPGMSVSDISVRRHYGDDNDNDDERFGRNSPVVVEI